jgi:hypothetical protein
VHTWERVLWYFVIETSWRTNWIQRDVKSPLTASHVGRPEERSPNKHQNIWYVSYCLSTEVDIEIQTRWPCQLCTSSYSKHRRKIRHASNHTTEDIYDACPTWSIKSTDATKDRERLYFVLYRSNRAASKITNHSHFIAKIDQTFVWQANLHTSIPLYGIIDGSF